MDNPCHSFDCQVISKNWCMGSIVGLGSRHAKAIVQKQIIKKMLHEASRCTEMFDVSPPIPICHIDCKQAWTARRTCSCPWRLSSTLGSPYSGKPPYLAFHKEKHAGSTPLPACIAFPIPVFEACTCRGLCWTVGGLFLRAYGLPFCLGFRV